MMNFGELHKNCTAGIVFENYLIMKDNKRDGAANESVHLYRTWSLKVFNYPFSHESFIVPWQINDNKYHAGHSEKDDPGNK
jgi:hypothetical protein